MNNKLNTMNNKLINKAGFEVVRGQQVTTFRGEEVEVIDWRAPHKPSSSGRVVVKNVNDSIREYFPSVIGCEIVVG